MSPAVCAGPTSISSIRAAADLEVDPAVEGAVGGTQLDAVELELAEERPEQFADLPRCLFSAASIDGGTSAISSAVADDAMMSTSGRRRVTSALP